MTSDEARGVSFQPSTLVDLLQGRAAGWSDRLAYVYLEDGESETRRVTYAQLDAWARAIAALLQEHDMAGERALLLYPPGLDFIAAFFGCLYAGVAAVPAYPPRRNRPSPRIQGIVTDARPQVALTTGQILSDIEQRFEQAPDLAALRWLDTEGVEDDAAGVWRPPTISPDTLAFLQYTSGSTGAPKGVMVSHENLMHNLEMIRQGFQIDSRASGVFWLPNYHDMGLIGGILEPMYINGHSILMPPAAFLQRPVRWLRVLSRYQGTITGAPNFAYQMCVDKVTPEQCEGLDLSRWEIAFCGAEPIRPETLRQFAETFGPYGFRPDAFYPCYGLAEATLLASGGEGPSRPSTCTVRAQPLTQRRAVPASPADDDVQTFVSCGHALLDQEIAIVDPETLMAREPGEIGEIWIAGSSVAQGYWDRPEESERAFRAYRADNGAGPYLRTGDLGFFHGGELYLAGRLKDLIIIRGRNHYPQDIEATVADSHEAFEPSMGAAFSVSVAGEERLVVTHELRRSHRHADAEEVTAAARQAIADLHGLQPYAVVLLRPLSIPKTSSGKVKRHACKSRFLDGSLKEMGRWQADEGAPAVDPAPAPPPQSTAQSTRRAAEIEAWLVDKIATQLSVAPGFVDPERPFVEYGLDSVQAVSLAGDLETWLGRSLSPTLIWDHPSIAALSRHLARDEGQGEETAALPAAPSSSPTANEPIAVIGLGCRFPGADGPDAFWRLLRDGVDAVGEVPAGRWDADAFYEADGGPGKMTTRWGGFLDEVDRFDPHFFGISPREAARMDPQQRLLLEVAWEALEYAGLPAHRLAGSQTGVFVGISSYDYSRLQFSDPQQIDAYAGTGNAHSVAANRLSYLLDFRGPSLSVDTACSSSLVAAHLAVQSLRSGESDLALAGGVNLLLSPELTITFSQARMMSADGRCKTFDARADGYVRGEGAGVVVLKRLSDALRDGDNVLAVLHGSAVNQDGRSNGLTAPHGPSQQAVIRQALANAGASPGDLSYVEAHGTGTPLGDPIEVQSLRAVLEEGDAPERCYLGSVKTNVGHLEAAAGVAGLIKVVLALQHQQIPPHLHFQELNPYISLDDSPLQIVAEGRPWSREGRPRLAGVSSFGFGGTNAHLILGDWAVEREEAGALPAPAEAEAVPLLPLSAKSQTALRTLAGCYADFLQENEGVSLADLCYTAATGRDHFAHRAAFMAGDRDALLSELRRFAQQPASATDRPLSEPIAFLFTGQGAQYPQMAHFLYESEPVFREALDRCAEILTPHLERPLLSVLFADEEAANHLVDETAYTQPVLFSVEYALAELWRSWGVEPDVVLGHSVGEYVAACVAGTFSLEHGLRLIAARGRLMQQLPRDGAMAVVFASEERVAATLEPYADRVNVAAVNGPENVTISGAATALEAVVEALEAQGVETRSLTVSHAFHSPLMAPILEPFAAIARTATFHPPRLPLVSNVTGRLFAEGEIPDADYWREHVRRPVRFADGVEALADAGVSIFLEVGPQPHLLGMGRRVLPEAEALWLPSLRRKRADDEVLRESLGALYEAGLDIDWDGVYAGRRQRKIPLPTYPFERERYWLDVAPSSSFPAPPPGDGVHRLPTAVPLYQAQLDLAELEAAAREMLRAVAADFWDGGAHGVDLFVDGEAAASAGRATVQVALTPQTSDLAACQLYRYDEAAETWRLLAAGQLRREAAPEGEPADAVEEPASAPAVEDEPVEDLPSYLHAQAAAVLGLARERLPLEQPLDGLGMDSLMAIELRNRVERDLNVTLPAVAFLEGPTVSELVEKIQTHLGDEEAGVEPITPTAREPDASLPLSYGQQAMWFLHQLLPDDLAFNVAGAVRLRGPVDVAALRGALQQVVDRHAALRTTFSLEAGQPVQRTLSHLDAPFAEVDASTWDEEELQQYLERMAYRPFDLESGPPLRLVLLRRAPQEYVLLLSVNHIVADFWSMSLLVQEMASLYQAATAGSEAALPSLPLDYGDYVLWQREALSGPEGERLRDYWRQQLDGDLPVLDLPTDHPRGTEQTFRGDVASRRLDPELTPRLRSLSQTHGATLSMTLLAAFQALLHRYTGQDDLLVGSVVAGRERPELARLVGYLINPVAMRADFSGDPTFASFLEQVRGTVLGAFAHQEYPLPLLAQDLSLTRDPGRPPLFETMFIMQKAQVMEGQGLSALALGMPGAQLELGDLRVESMQMGNLPAQFDLTLMMAEVEEALAAAFHYNSGLFEAETVEWMLDHLERLLWGVVEDPERPISSLPLLSAGERKRLLVDWNRTEVAYPRDKCLHQLIEEQVERTPERVAAEAGGRQITYAQLNERANQVAHTLRRRGVGPGDLAGVAVERSLEMLVAVLGVLKAGGAYVPLDPNFPPARLALMLEDAQPKVVLTQERLARSLGEVVGEAGVICLDTDAEKISQARRCNPKSAAGPEDLAYVIYTSGSTGRPKGVQIPHRAVTNFLWSMRDRPGITPDDVLLAVTTLSFDIAVLELYLPLITGARVVIAGADAAADGAQLGQLLEASGATIMQATPATWRMLLAAGWEGSPTLQKVLCGGEALTPDLAAALLARDVALWNMYGPTETTVWSTTCRVETAEPPISIGRPIANTQIYILDGNLEPVPAGVAGDLYIGGDGVAYGYLNRPALTSDRFLPDPFAAASSPNGPSASASPKMYRTGDLARYLPGGDLLFLGRRDHQVKVHGFRIELGDVEAALGEHPAVQQGVVVAQGSGAERRLAAYLVLRDGADAPAAGDVRRFLRQRLPDYMVPASFTTLDELPLTPNNKVDRRALPEPEPSRMRLETPFVAPRNALEERLAALCAQTLGWDTNGRRPEGRSTIGIHDNFFDLGGNSLLATRLIFQVREQFQVQVPLRYLFAEPTVAGLARAVEAGQNGAGENGHWEGGWRKTAEELNADAVLDPEINAASQSSNFPAESSISEPSLAQPSLAQSSLAQPDHVLLTGATGFVGAFLLRDLLAQTEATVHCLVRAADGAAGRERLRQNLERYGLWRETFDSRIKAVCGDLAQPRLALSDETFQRLSRQVDVIYHNGAMVNFVYPYEAHKAANVLGSQEVLRLAAAERLKPVHFVSTLSVFHTGGHDDGAVFAEDDDLDDVGAPFGGYAQSKWVAEKLMLEADGRGIPVAIYRPGLVTGDSETGAWNTDDMMSTLARACLVVGAVPELDVMVDVVPVDYVSGAIVRLSQQASSLGQTFHLANPEPMPYTELVAWVRSLGFSLETVPFAEWRRRLFALAGKSDDDGDGAEPFLPLLEEVTAEQVFMPSFDCRRALDGLEDSDVACPPVGPSLLSTYLAYFGRQGALPAREAEEVGNRE